MLPEVVLLTHESVALQPDPVTVGALVAWLYVVAVIFFVLDNTVCVITL